MIKLPSPSCRIYLASIKRNFFVAFKLVILGSPHSISLKYTILVYESFLCSNKIPLVIRNENDIAKMLKCEEKKDRAGSSFRTVRCPDK